MDLFMASNRARFSAILLDLLTKYVDACKRRLGTAVRDVWDEIEGLSCSTINIYIYMVRIYISNVLYIGLCSVIACEN